MTRILIPILPFALAAAAPFIAAYVPPARSLTDEIAPLPDPGFLPALRQDQGSDASVRPFYVG